MLRRRVPSIVGSTSNKTSTTTFRILRTAEREVWRRLFPGYTHDSSFSSHQDAFRDSRDPNLASPITRFRSHHHCQRSYQQPGGGLCLLSVMEVMSRAKERCGQRVHKEQVVTAGKKSVYRTQILYVLMHLWGEACARCPAVSSRPTNDVRNPATRRSAAVLPCAAPRRTNNGPVERRQ